MVFAHDFMLPISVHPQYNGQVFVGIGKRGRD
jgi:hypothetical protein